MTNVDPAADYAAYGDLAPTMAPESGNLDTIRGMCIELLEAQSEVARITAELEKANDTLKDLRERRLPEMMEQNELPEFVFRDKATGARMSVSVGEEVRVSLPKDNREAGYKWLTKMGLEAIIKRTIEISVGQGKGAKAKAKKVLSAAKKHVDRKLSGRFNEKVEPATLRSQIIQQMEAGVDVPGDIFNVYRQRVANVEVA